MRQRVELNAMTSRQLVDFVERKLNEHGVTKLIPDADTLARTYRMFVASDQLSEKFEELEDRLEDEAHDVKVPADLRAKVEKLLEEKRHITWHRAVRLVVDPDAPEDEDDDEKDHGEDEDDEDLSEIE